MKSILFALLVSLSFHTAFADDSQCNKILADLPTINGAGAGGPPRSTLPQELEDMFSVIDNQYGPIVIKNKTVGLDWDKVKEEYRAKVKTLTNSNDFYYLVADLLSQFDDAHISVSMPSTLTYSLPLQFSYADGKTIVTFIDDDSGLSSGALQIGDELVSINGTSVHDFRVQHPTLNKFGNDLTNSALFARMLGHLTESSGLNFGTIPIASTFTFKRAEKTFDLPMTFTKSGVGFIGRPLLPPTESFVDNSREAQVKREIERLNQSGVISAMPADQAASFEKIIGSLYQFQDLFNLETALPVKDRGPRVGEGTNVELAHVKPTYQLPADFTVIEPPDNLKAIFNADSFFAGTFNSNGKRVGLLRIPSYEVQNMTTLPLSIRYYIAKLEQASDVLIIDQMDNPGGAIIYSDLLIKSLTGKLDPAKNVNYATKPIQSWLRQYAELIDNVQGMSGGPFSPEEQANLLTALKTNYDKVYSAFVAGKELSDPVSLTATTEFFEGAVVQSLAKFKAGPLSEKALGVDVFSAQTYSKPVFFMINELDFSGGDATPASFQDYGRGKLVGVRSAGAGGTVEEYSHRFSTEFGFHLTTSLMIRKDGSIIENVGVHPDIDFPVTVQDYENRFADFLPRLLKTLGL